MYNLLWRILVQISKISQTTIVYVCSLYLPWVSGITIHDHEHSFPVRAGYLGYVAVEKFVVVIHNDVPEVVCRDFIVACVRWHQFFCISLVTVIYQMLLSLFLCLVTILKEKKSV